MDELVSIIVPIYNPPEGLLQNCVGSILRQTYQCFELILVNDGSEQETSNLIKRLSMTDARIRTLYQENKGVSAARNRGIEIACGKYLTFVDADDCLPEKWLAIAVKYAEQEQADIVYGKIWRGELMSQERLKSESLSFQVYERNDLWRIQESLLCQEKCIPPMTNKGIHCGPYGKLFTRDCVGTIRFPEGIRISEDQVFNHEVLRRCNRCVVCDSIAYYNIENFKSVSHTYHPDAVSTMVQALELIRNNLFLEKCVTEAFDFRVMDEMRIAFKLAYMNGRNAARSRGGYAHVLDQILGEPLVQDSLHRIHLLRYRKGFCIQVWMLRHNMRKIYMLWICRICDVNKVIWVI